MRWGWNEEKGLVRKAIGGDSESAEKLVSRHYPSIVRFLLHLTGHLNEAEELAQDTFVRAWPKLDTFEGRSSFRTWLHRIAFREFAARRGLPDFIELPEGHGDTKQNFVGPLVEALAMERAIASLPESLRITFVLCHVQELSAKEAAEILSVPVGTVLSRLHSARERLRRQLEMREIVAVASELEGHPTPERQKYHEMSKIAR